MLSTRVRATRNYLARQQARLGTFAVKFFLRYYEVTVLGHSVSSTFNAGWDQLTANEKWIERGLDPATDQIVIDIIGLPERT